MSDPPHPSLYTMYYVSISSIIFDPYNRKFAVLSQAILTLSGFKPHEISFVIKRLC